MKTLPVILFSIIVLASCTGKQSPERANGYSEKPKTQQDSLFQQVMDGHDAAMARLGKLTAYRKRATQKADSLAKMGPTEAAQVRMLRSLSEKLQAAENRMDTWMDAFSIDSNQNDPPKRIAYLESEKKKVSAVRDEVLSVAAQADSILNKK